MSISGEAKREYQRKWISRRRSEYLEGKSCFMCGSIDGLELDHRDPSQKISHSIWSWSRDRIESELSKCDWLCKDCHRLKTLFMDLKLASHGTETGYRNGCRCRPCTDAKLRTK